MPKAVTTYKCEYCDKPYKTKRGVDNHEKVCPENYANTSRTSIQKEIEQIRVTATSPYDLITKLQEFWISHGIKVTFNDYPARFDLSVSNSHNAPRGYRQNWCGRSTGAGVPTGYPGWKGRWEGEVEVLDTCTIAKKGMYFSGLTGSWSDHAMDVWYIQTGGGSGGERFQYDGMLWLYDFPLMHKEFEDNGGKFEVYNKEYNNLLDQYETAYLEAKQRAIGKDSDLKRALKMSNDLQEVSTRLRNCIDKTKTILGEKFTATYQTKLPEVTSAIKVDHEKIKNISIATSCSHRVEELPELADLLSKIEDLTKEANDYVEARPELLF